MAEKPLFAGKGRSRRGGPGEGPEDTEAKELKTARFDAEQRFRKLVERRNALNDEARQAREARDAINTERRRIYDEAQALMEQRQKLGDRIKEHKAGRNQSQARARQLIGLKQEKRKGAIGGAGQRVRELEGAIKALEFKQQTTPMSAKAEEALLDDIKAKVRELEDARKAKAQQDLVFGEVKDLDAAITEAFQQADAGHAQVVALSNEWQALTDRLEPAFRELGHLKGEADKRHQDYLDLRKRADEEHQKASELRGEVDAKRGAEQALWQERKQVVQDLKKQVRDTFENPERIEATADEAIRLLKEKGRISL
jgi:uncharacterized coiled-coil DUF342 family protein